MALFPGLNFIECLTTNLWLYTKTRGQQCSNDKNKPMRQKQGQGKCIRTRHKQDTMHKTKFGMYTLI